MDINDILSTLGLDLSDPEARRGALEAIDAILTSRAPISSADLGSAAGLGGMETEVELDPDLLQPSVKQAPSDADDTDIEIEDEEKILDQIKHKESEDPIENTNSNGDSSESDESQNSKESDDNSQNNSNSSDSDSAPKEDNKKTDTDGKSDASDKKDSSDTSNDNKTDDELKNSTEDEEEATIDDEESDSNNEFGDSTGESNKDSEVDSNDLEDDSNLDDFDDPIDDADSDKDDIEEFDNEDSDNDDSYDDIKNDVDISDNFSDFDDDDDDNLDDENSEEDKSDNDEEFEFDEEDFLDDELKNSTEDEEEKTKHGARKIKRERTLAAAKKALADAQAKKVAPALIRELEKSIEALEALTEAVAKSIKDISDEEFNLLVNRVFDAIDACGGSGLTFTSDEERQARAQEIKTDLAKAETQNELSAEDVAQIRAETQAIKAREKEAAKYAPKASGSFKGFQEFLNSLYKAIALQVDNEEARDDSWSAINRRYSGTGILQPGKKINDLPNRRIPVIDFYFDCSLSWDQDDIEIGKKAVAALADLEQKGQIKVNIYYFSNNVSQNYNDVAGHSTKAWNHIIKNIIATQANNVVIMTDEDMETQGKYEAGASGHLKYTIPGYVWYLWKNGANAPRLPRDLKGRGGVQQFSFNASDV